MSSKTTSAAGDAVLEPTLDPGVAGVREPVVHALGRPTRELPLSQLLTLSIYWLGINAMWTGLHVIVLPKRMEALFGPASAGLALGLITVAGVITAVLVQPTVGAISDYTVSRWGRRKPYIVIGSLLDVIFLWAVASAETYVAIVIALVLLQFSSNFAQGPFQGYVPDLVPARQVGRASALMGIMIILGGMAGVGIAAIGYLQLQPEMAEPAVREILFWPTVALGFVEVATMVVLAFTVHEGRAASPRDGRSWWRIGLSAWGTDILRERSYVWLLVSRLCYLAIPGVITAYAVFVLERSFNLPPAVAAPFLLVNGLIVAISTALATIPAARLSDRIGRKKVIYVAFALAAVGVAGLALAPTLELALLSLMPIGFSAGAFLVVDWALLTDIIPKASSGRYMGISNVATASSGPVGLALAGVVLFLVTRAGLPTPDSPDLESTLLGAAPRAAIGSMLIFVAIAAWALRKVDETRRED
ncbi:MAG TPA: MFS transporter [Candidatus Limnocylindrales bacterium]|nr:MFS transporter [Candidatus Limnocylindrales bacterium]